MTLIDSFTLQNGESKSAVFVSQNLHLCERLFKMISVCSLTDVIEFKHIISH